jgi:hypothetical protein
MNNLNTYKVSFAVIGNYDCPQAVGFSTSVREAIKKASEKAWDLFYKSPNTNWADCWVVVYNPKGKQICSGFEGELQNC